jgi:alpha-tubulin suppressor-like RCC1 family protein
MGEDLPSVDLDGAATWVVRGGASACAGLEGGAVKCWGANMNGALGLGDTENRGDEPDEMGDALAFVDVGMAVEELAAGHTTCARDGLGRVKCWGANGTGQLGLGDTESRGDEPGEMGGELPFVDLGEGAEAVQVAGWWDTTCVLLSTGRVKCWGTTNTTWFDLWPGADGYIGDAPGEMGGALPELSTEDGRDVVEVEVGHGFFCVRLDDGGVRCVGYNEFGQLGQGHDDTLTRWLSDVPDTDLGEPAVQLGLGDSHACVLLESGNVKCWGKYGGTSYGDTEHRGDEPGEMGDALPYVELF